MSDLFLGILETAGNQSYIFATNRLRENVGASQRVWQAGVEFTYRAAQAVTSCTGYKDLLTSAKNGPASHAQAMSEAPRLHKGAGIEIVVATSGKALFLAQRKDAAEQLIARATRMALEEAPGLTLRGAIAKIAGCDANAASTAVRDVHEQLESIRDHLPAPEIRFPTLPILEPCASSGLPATKMVGYRNHGRKPTAYSDATLAKRNASNDGYQRIARSINPRGCQEEANAIARSIGDMEKSTDWIGIIHSDGNGMGQLFLEFGTICGQTTLDGYFDAYRRFSSSLDLCGVAAFRAALNEAYPASKRRKNASLLPLVLGGDDLTLLCDGRIAVRLAASYLKQFQEHTKKDMVLGQCSWIPTILKHKGWTKLGAAAGVAITKPHYPFHRGYELAERLLRQAKTAKNEVGVSRCCFDFHLLFDGAETTLDDLRERWTSTGTHVLTARPYVLGEETAMDAMWARNRKWEDLQEAAEALRVGGRTEDEDTLPRSQQYALRTALFRGPEAADRQLALIRHRYPGFSWETVAYETSDGTPSLFFPIDGKGGFACRLLDAMELADLEPGDDP